MPILPQCAGKAIQAAGISPHQVRTPCLEGVYHRMLFFHLHCAAVHGRSRVESVTSSVFIAQRHGQAPIRICLHATPFPGQSDCACDAHIVCAGGLTCWLVQVDVC